MFKLAREAVGKILHSSKVAYVDVFEKVCRSSQIMFFHQLLTLSLAVRSESSFKAAFGGSFAGFEDSSPTTGAPCFYRLTNDYQVVGRIIGFVNFENDFQNELLLLRWGNA